MRCGWMWWVGAVVVVVVWGMATVKGWRRCRVVRARVYACVSLRARAGVYVSYARVHVRMWVWLCMFGGVWAGTEALRDSRINASGEEAGAAASFAA